MTSITEGQSLEIRKTAAGFMACTLWLTSPTGIPSMAAMMKANDLSVYVPLPDTREAMIEFYRLVAKTALELLEAT